ncbi:MAG: hypothetical protein ACM3UK_00105 [Actinomycetes bacterium]
MLGHFFYVLLTKGLYGECFTINDHCQSNVLATWLYERTPEKRGEAYVNWCERPKGVKKRPQIHTNARKVFLIEMEEGKCICCYVFVANIFEKEIE